MQIASITTNGQGEYEYATEEDYLEQTLDFVIQKEGFEIKNISYEIDKAEIKSDILLNELEKGTKEKTRIFGIIRNSKNRDPVKAASIKLSIEGTQIASVSSNEQGEYEYTADEDYTGQTLDFIIQKEGFIKKNISSEIDKLEIKSDILIDKIEIEIKGKICDKADLPLADASISFKMGDKTIKLISDKDGSFSFTAGQQFLNRTIGYEVSKEGFKVKSGKLELIEDLKCINLDPINPIPPIKVATVLIVLSGLAILLFALPVLIDILQDESPELAIDPEPLNFNFRPDTKPQIISIWNEGEENLEWEVNADRDWITLTPSRGTETGTVIVSVNSADLRPGSYTGSITVTSNGGTETGIISLNIEGPIIHYFMTDPENIDNAGGKSTLRWEVSGATSVAIDGIGKVDPVGKKDVYPDLTTIYILRATNEAGKDVKTVIVNVGDEPIELPIIHSFTADPNSISVGEESTLRWDVSGATSVAIDGIGRVNSAGERNVDPGINTKYILEATSEAGLSNFKTVTVKVEELPPRLSVNPDKLNFGTMSKEDEKSLTFEISNDGGGTLNWRVDDKPDWIDISQTSGYSVPVTITVSANTANLDAGHYEQNIVIGSDDGGVSIPVTLKIEELPLTFEELPPKLSVDPEKLDFGTIYVGEEENLEFEISNIGGGTLIWDVSDKPDWIAMETSGSLGTVTVTDVKVTANTENWDPGHYEQNIVIGSNDGDVYIPVILKIEEIQPKLSVNQDILNFGTISVGDEKSLTFDISNDGGGTLNWNVREKPYWITINPEHGSSGTVTVTASNANLKAGVLYRGIIEIDSNGGTKRIMVQLIGDDIKYVKYLVSQEEDLIVPNGLCEDGTKECELFYKSHGGYYYAMVGNYVALNGNPEKLKTITIDDKIVLYVGQRYKISDGIELTAVEIDVEGGKVWLALIQDGKELTSSNVGKGEIFTYTEKQIEGEYDVPMFVAYVETMFAGMNTNMVKIRYVWSIIQ